MSYYYGFTVDEINKMSLVQFIEYQKQLGKILKEISGEGDEPQTQLTSPPSSKDFIEQMRQLGLPVPKK